MAARRWIKLIALCALVVLSMQKRLKKRAEPKERSIIQEMDALNVSEEEMKKLGTVDELLQHAYSALQAGALPDAYKLMILALKQDPTNKQARFSVLMFLISSGKERQAVVEVKAMMDNPDEQRAIVVALGREMMRQRLAQTADVDWELPRPLYRHAVELGILQDEYQRPFALLNSNLSPIAMWPSSDFSFISKIERKAKDIRTELEQQLSEAEFVGVEEARGMDFLPETLARGNIECLILWNHGQEVVANTRLLPALSKLLRHDDITTNPLGQTRVERVFANTKLHPRCGSNNLNLVAHIPLTKTSKPSKIRVRQDWHNLREGKALVFDESFENEEEHSSEEFYRLVVTFWHPDIEEAEKEGIIRSYDYSKDATDGMSEEELREFVLKESKSIPV